MKVLVADDEPVSRRLLESSLRRWGYEPVVASDGFEALAILQQQDSPKLAILDWLMPGVDGLEVCRRIRRQYGRTLHLRALAHRQEFESRCRSTVSTPAPTIT